MCKHFTVWPKSDDAPDIRTMMYFLGSGLRVSAASGNNIHGTGIAYVKDNVPVVIKSGQKAADYTLSDAWYSSTEHLTFTQPLLGHVRRASTKLTAREYPDEDAHPFHVGDVILAHNGTISNYQEVVKANKLTKDKIDSYAIAELIAKLSYPYTVEALNSVTSQLEGSFALVFTNIKDPDTLWVCRHEKPLHCVDVDGVFGVIVTDMDALKLSLIDTENASRMFLGQEMWHKHEDKVFIENKWYTIKGKEITSFGDVTYKIPPKAAAAPYTPGNAGVGYSKILKETFDIVDLYEKMLEVFVITPIEFRLIYDTLLNAGDNPMSIGCVEDVTGFLTEVMLTSEENITKLEELIDMKVYMDGDSKYFLGTEEDGTDKL